MGEPVFMWGTEPGVGLEMSRKGNGVELVIVSDFDKSRYTVTLESYRAERLAQFIRREPPWDA